MSGEDDISETSSKVPRHVAIIMDGNGRWAKKRGLPRVEGHRRGAETVKKIVKAADQSGIRFLTLFGFSSENWNRPKDEVGDLMGLVKFYLKREIDELHENNVRFAVIGDRERLSEDVTDVIEFAERRTLGNSGLTLVLALSYGGRADITSALKQIAQQVECGETSASDIDETLVSNHLYTRGFPDPDLLIRTGGDQRISNFLLWQMAYTEFWFTDCFWPDFDEKALVKALVTYGIRERRYGNIGE